MCFNLSDSVIKINKGDKIAQMLINKLYKLDIKESNELDNTERGDNGFGSTGIVSSLNNDNDVLVSEIIEEPIVKKPKRKPKKEKK